MKKQHETLRSPFLCLGLSRVPGRGRRRSLRDVEPLIARLAERARQIGVSPQMVTNQLAVNRDQSFTLDPIRSIMRSPTHVHGESDRLDLQVLRPARTLVYIPIIHTQADMGDLGASLQRIKASTFERRRLLDSADLVDRMWQEIEETVERLPIVHGQTRVYQDGLPVCPQEARIVSDLAEAGSRNYKLLHRLVSRGAVLMGTEAPELLVEEYQLALTALHSGGAGGARRRELRGAALLERRDRYIATRINSTLQPGETGILFLGMLHAVQTYLDRDINIVYPVRDIEKVKPT